ncbi:helix-turn-helix transcriptional regulator [Haemophilus parahaemolyticus]|nr:AlpA family phage regulatory protein [Haemophilus parahaemolyticus]
MIDRIIRPKELLSILGISKSTFYAWQDQNSKYFKSDFPKKLV